MLSPSDRRNCLVESMRLAIRLFIGYRLYDKELKLVLLLLRKGEMEILLLRSPQYSPSEDL